MSTQKFGRFVAGNTVDVYFNPAYYVKDGLLASTVTSGTTTDTIEFWTPSTINAVDGDIVVCNQFGGTYKADGTKHLIEVTKDTFPDGVAEWQEKYYTELFIFSQKTEITGTEIVSNGDFSNGSTGWQGAGQVTITGGYCNFGATTDTYAGIRQFGILTVGKSYRLTLDVLNVEDMTGGLWMFNNGSEYITIPDDGRVEYYFTCDDTDLRLTNNDIVCDIDIDNISIYEASTSIDGNNFGVFEGCYISSVRQRTKSNSFDESGITFNPVDSYIIYISIKDIDYEVNKRVNIYNKLQQMIMSPVLGVSSCDDDAAASYTYLDNDFRKTDFAGASYNPSVRMGVCDSNSIKTGANKEDFLIQIELYG